MRDWDDPKSDVRYLLDCKLCGHQFIGRRRRKLCRVCVDLRDAMKADDERMVETMAQIVNTFGAGARLVLIKVDETAPGTLSLRIAHHNLGSDQTLAVMAQAAEILRESIDSAPTLH